MTTFPKPIKNRFAYTVKQALNKLAVHGQQIVNLQTQVASVVPGDWEDLSLENGWSNLGGYIPAQVRILQNGMSQLIGHITGGSVSNGTVIGTLTAGYFNTVHAHAFSVNAITGAQAVAHSGSGNVNDSTVIGSTISTGQRTLIPTGNHTIPSSGAILGPSGIQFDNFDSPITTNNTNMNNTALTSSTNVNMNSPTMTLDTSGNLTINNVDPNVSTLSFSELIPLITA